MVKHDILLQGATESWIPNQLVSIFVTVLNVFSYLNRMTGLLSKFWPVQSYFFYLVQKGWNTCDVPQLKTNCLLVPIENFKCKVHPNGGSVVGVEVVMHIALDDAGLANAEVPDHKDLIQMFLLVVVVHDDQGVWELSINTPELRGWVRRERWRNSGEQSSALTERKNGRSALVPAGEGGPEYFGPCDWIKGVPPERGETCQL